eukprot:SAG11_NODE_99_length_16913_cov_41.552813_16_plen_162_part_00
MCKQPKVLDVLEGWEQNMAQVMHAFINKVLLNCDTVLAHRTSYRPSRTKVIVEFEKPTQKITATTPTINDCTLADINATVLGDWYMPADRKTIRAWVLAWGPCAHQRRICQHSGQHRALWRRRGRDHAERRRPWRGWLCRRARPGVIAAHPRYRTKKYLGT